MFGGLPEAKQEPVKEEYLDLYRSLQPEEEYAIVMNAANKELVHDIRDSDLRQRSYSYDRGTFHE